MACTHGAASCGRQSEKGDDVVLLTDAGEEIELCQKEEEKWVKLVAARPSYLAVGQVMWPPSPC
jgi:hypothetical protein